MLSRSEALAIKTKLTAQVIKGLQEKGHKVESIHDVDDQYVDLSFGDWGQDWHSTDAKWAKAVQVIYYGSSGRNRQKFQRRTKADGQFTPDDIKELIEAISSGVDRRKQQDVARQEAKSAYERTLEYMNQNFEMKYSTAWVEDYASRWGSLEAKSDGSVQVNFSIRPENLQQTQQVFELLQQLKHQIELKEQAAEAA